MKSPHGHFGTDCQLFPFTTHQLWLIDCVLTKLLQKKEGSRGTWSDRGGARGVSGVSAI